MLSHDMANLSSGSIELREDTVENLLSTACMLQLSEVVEACCLRGFRPGPTQTELYNHVQKMARGLKF